jgi:hypothetical protein
MIHCGAELSALGPQLYRKLLIASEVTRQQQEMVDADSRRIDDRIVNLSKPHVRAIVRGKAGKKTEFGAKISLSDDNGFVDVDRISWDNYNEANDLIARAEQYKEERGCYPARICADSIYMTSDRLLRLLLSILVTVYILILDLCASRRRPALLWAA